MGWVANTLESIKSHTKSEPIECPRGWGQVAFVASVWVVPPLFGVDRRCPIANAGACSSCSYAQNPDAFRLSEQLAELERLRAERQITAEQLEIRRQAVVHLHAGSEGGRKAMRTTAWLLGPLGLLATVVGVGLALNFHSAFWGLAALGSVFLVLTLSFWALSRPKSPSPSA